MTALLSSTNILPIAIAFLAVIIGYCQFQISLNKLKLDLFDKRYAVYIVAHKFLLSIKAYNTVDDIKVPDNDIAAFKAETGKAKWLFDDKIDSYFKEIRTKAYELKTLIDELEDVNNEEQHKINVGKKGNILDWMENQIDELEGRCTPFLKLGHKIFPE